MKKSTLFWGVFLILTGVFLILSKTDLLTIDFDCIYNYWPLFLVFWGVSLLNIPDVLKKLLVVFNAILLAMLLSGFFSNGISSVFHCNDDYVISEKNVDNEYHKSVFKAFDNKIKYAELNIDAGASNIRLKDKSDDLFAVYSYLPDSYFDLDSDVDSDKAIINLDFKFNNLFWKKHGHNNQVNIKLNTEPIWSFDFDLGAVNLNADLTNYKVKNVGIDIGASNFKLKLGDYYFRTDVDIEAGASHIYIKIPKDSYCEIISQTGLSSKDFDGFIKENGIYKTENPHNFSNKIFINLEGGVSKFEIVRY